MHTRPDRRALLLGALVLATGPSRAELLGQDPATPPPPEEVAARDLEAANPGAGEGIYRVPGFDPVRDVPAMRNWGGVWEDSLGGHCYAIAVLTHYFFQKVELVEEAGVSPREFLEADGDAVLSMDHERSADLLVWILSGEPRFGPSPERPRVRVSGGAGLNAWTAQGTAGEAFFREIAEAIHMHMQTTTEGHHALGGVIKANLGFLPWLGRDAVNRDGVHILRDRIREGRTVALSMHGDREPGGHVVLAHAYREFSDRVEVEAYDMNSPPSGGRADPLVITFDTQDWTFAARRRDGRRRYRYPIVTLLDPDRRRARSKFRSIGLNPEESLERNRHVARLLGEGSSLGDRVRGAAGFVVEVLNPF